MNLAKNNFFRGYLTKIFSSFKNKIAEVRNLLSSLSLKSSLSLLVMGLGQLLYKKRGKGLIYLFIQIGALLYFGFIGGRDLIGLFTLGTVQSDPWNNIVGDNSLVMMILGLVAVAVLIFYFIIYISNIKDVYQTQICAENNLKQKTLKDEFKSLLNEKFHFLTLFLPIVGVMIFNVLPIVFMILIAFTNYNGTIADNNLLVSWVGFDNFATLVRLGEVSSTFFKILGWNVVWAIASTALNYFAGLGLALLYNKKRVKGKVFWRVFPILAYAVPGFITLLGFKFMFSYGGPINQTLMSLGIIDQPLGFLDLDAKTSSRIIGLFVNSWLSVPSIMLLSTGILSNARADLYEVASLHGARPMRQFLTITLPYVVFATTPVLITQFIGNFNNFGVFYFLRGGLVIDGYFLASDTDLLINWLYNLSISNNHYGIGGAISLIIFLITSVLSLIVYVTSPAYKQEDTYK